MHAFVLQVLYGILSSIVSVGIIFKWIGAIKSIWIPSVAYVRWSWIKITRWIIQRSLSLFITHLRLPERSWTAKRKLILMHFSCLLHKANTVWRSVTWFCFRWCWGQVRPILLKILTSYDHKVEMSVSQKSFKMQISEPVTDSGSVLNMFTERHKPEKIYHHSFVGFRI